MMGPGWSGEPGDDQHWLPPPSEQISPNGYDANYAAEPPKEWFVADGVVRPLSAHYHQSMNAVRRRATNLLWGGWLVTMVAASVPAYKAVDRYFDRLDAIDQREFVSGRVTGAKAIRDIAQLANDSTALNLAQNNVQSLQARVESLDARASMLPVLLLSASSAALFCFGIAGTYCSVGKYERGKELEEKMRDLPRHCV